MMNTSDLVWLAVFLLALTALLVFSRTVRLIVWQALRHPLSRGYIVTYDDGTVEYLPERDDEGFVYGQQPTQPAAPQAAPKS